MLRYIGKYAKNNTFSLIFTLIRVLGYVRRLSYSTISDMTETDGSISYIGRKKNAINFLLIVSCKSLLVCKDSPNYSKYSLYGMNSK